MHHKTEKIRTSAAMHEVNTFLSHFNIMIDVKLFYYYKYNTYMLVININQ